MKIAVGTSGNNLDAALGSELGLCPNFVVVDTASLGCSLLPTLAETSPEASRALASKLEHRGVSTVIIGQARPECARLLRSLGFELVEMGNHLTVRQAVERFVGQTLFLPEGETELLRIAVASDGNDLDAPVGTGLGRCSRFIMVEPESLTFRVVEVTPKTAPEDVSVEAIKAVVRAGAWTVITPHVQPRCLRLLSQMGVEVILCEPGQTVRQALEQFLAGDLAPA